MRDTIVLFEKEDGEEGRQRVVRMTFNGDNKIQRTTVIDGVPKKVTEIGVPHPRFFSERNRYAEASLRRDLSMFPPNAGILYLGEARTLLLDGKAIPEEFPWRVAKYDTAFRFTREEEEAIIVYFLLVPVLTEELQNQIVTRGLVMGRHYPLPVQEHPLPNAFCKSEAFGSRTGWVLARFYRLLKYGA